MKRFGVLTISVLLFPIAVQSQEIERLAPDPQTGFQQVRIWLPGQDRTTKPIEMIQIPPGQFQMGTPKNEYGRTTQEHAVHTVTLTKSFWIGKYEVTQEQWRALVGRDLELTRTKGPDNPVYSVSWWDIKEFTDKMTALGFGTFRLPTEAEWEYCCRAGTTTPFWFGDAIYEGQPYEEEVTRLKPYVWYEQTARGRNQAVGQKKPNPWGLYDVHGNIAEYCSDYFLWTSDPNPAVDPIGPPGPGPRVIRDGNYAAPPGYCRSGMRGFFTLLSGERSDYVGFRLAGEIRTAVEEWAGY